MKPSFEATITTNRPQDDHYEQSSDEIWQRCGEAVRSALRASEIKAESVVVHLLHVEQNVLLTKKKQSYKGIAFDATCSLYASIGVDRPVSFFFFSISLFPLSEWLWMTSLHQLAYLLLRITHGTSLVRTSSTEMGGFFFFSHF